MFRKLEKIKLASLKIIFVKSDQTVIHNLMDAQKRKRSVQFLM